jgi:putative addiction module component (TIGR02574 family)
MSPTASQLLEQALDLPDDERAELVVRLLDSIDGISSDTAGDEGAAALAAWIAEARQRLSELDSGEIAATPWSEARVRIFAPRP